MMAMLLFGCSGNSSIPNSKSTYNEKYRPQFHFSPVENWMNDPNGMVYLDGEYHLFYQYYPDSTVWGPMHWGHAVSEDLVHWKHLPIALYPDSLGYIFSGSAVYDSSNTSGLGTREQPPLVAIFTYHDPKREEAGSEKFQTQGIAYSTDHGRTWEKYDKNPVLSNPGERDFRDPKVYWHESTGKWIMTLAVGDHISFYSSPDLKTWTHESDFGKDRGAHGGVWECPDLFHLTYNGEEKWVLFVSINPGAPNGGSGTQYFIGDFDGQTFASQQTEAEWIDYGTDNYAGVTWSNVPDSSTYFIGWMSNWAYATIVPTEKWRSAMTVVRTLQLYRKNQRYLVKSRPVQALDKLYDTTYGLKDFSYHNGRYLLNHPVGTADMTMSIRQAPEDTVTIRFFNGKEELLIHVEPDKDRIVIDRTGTGDTIFSKAFYQKHSVPFSDSVYILRILKDVSSLELFFNDGERVVTEIYFANKPLTGLEIIGGTTDTLKVHELRSIWNNQYE